MWLNAFGSAEQYPVFSFIGSYSLVLPFESCLLKKQSRCSSWLYVCMETQTTFC